MDKISKHIGKVFQQHRIMNNLTQNEVAEIAGMEPRYISQIERGVSKGSIDTLLKLCNAYQITPDVVLYDLLDKSVKKKEKDFLENFIKLSKKDKETIIYLMEYLLNRK